MAVVFERGDKGASNQQIALGIDGLARDLADTLFAGKEVDTVDRSLLASDLSASRTIVGLVNKVAATIAAGIGDKAAEVLGESIALGVVFDADDVVIIQFDDDRPNMEIGVDEFLRLGGQAFPGERHEIHLVDGKATKVKVISVDPDSE